MRALWAVIDGPVVAGVTLQKRFWLSLRGPRPSWLVPKGGAGPPPGAICIPRQDYPSSLLQRSIYGSPADSLRQQWTALHVRVGNESPWNLPSGSQSQTRGLEGNQWVHPWGRAHAHPPGSLQLWVLSWNVSTALNLMRKKWSLLKGQLQYSAL